MSKTSTATVTRKLAIAAVAVTENESLDSGQVVKCPGCVKLEKAMRRLERTHAEEKERLLSALRRESHSIDLPRVNHKDQIK